MTTNRTGNWITLLVLCFVFASFLVPNFVLSMQEKQLEEQVFTRDKKISKLDVEAEKIYLVKAIHEIEENSNSIFTQQKQVGYTTKGKKEEFRLTEIGKQMEKLQDTSILQEIGIDIPISYTMYSNIIGYQNNHTQYFLENIQLVIEEDKYELVRESKTNKLLSVACAKEKLQEGRSKQEILQSFIEYLDLYIIDDWKYEEGMIQAEQNNRQWKYEIRQMKSDKADLTVVLLEDDEYYMLGVRPQDDLYRSGMNYVIVNPSVEIVEAVSE